MGTISKKNVKIISFITLYLMIINISTNRLVFCFCINKDIRIESTHIAGHNNKTQKSDRFGLLKSFDDCRDISVLQDLTIAQNQKIKIVFEKDFIYNLLSYCSDKRRILFEYNDFSPEINISPQYNPQYIVIQV